MKIIIAVNYFSKHFIADVWQGSEYALDFEYSSVLNIPGFWIHQGCKYARLLNMLLILIILGFCIYHSSKYVRVLNMTECVWIIPGYAWLWLNVPKSVWMVFVLHLPVVIPYLKEPYTVFWESKNLIFFYSGWKYLILFVLDWIFWQIRFQIAVTFGGRGGRGPSILPTQWYTKYIYLRCFFNDVCAYFVVAFYFLVLQMVNQRFMKAVTL